MNDRAINAFLNGLGDSLGNISDKQREALRAVISALSLSYRQTIFLDLQNRLMFENDRIYYRTILNKLQDCIFDLIDRLSDTMEIRKEDGFFMTNYEAKRRLMLYALKLVINTKDIRIMYFVEKVKSRVLDY